MEGLPAFHKGDNVEDYLVQFSTWLNNQPNLDAVLRGLVARTDQPVTFTDDVTMSDPVTISDTLSVSGAATISGAMVFSYAPAVPVVANGAVAAVFTANKGPTGLAVDINGWIQVRNSAGTLLYIPCWAMA